ncbi:MAG TPA: GntR family transcriptional regulator [Burkholderiaceae bacterium]|nr:GntR family transcriptional regulator [Burkholderiaceae bacterium]
MQRTRRLWGPAARLTSEDQAKTLADRAYHRIREDIIRGVHAPQERLQPELLRERYDIGLSPIREALSRLALDGLAVAESQRGFFVAPVSKAELLDLADLRIRFAVLALKRAIRHGDDQWETGIVTTYYQLNKLERQIEADPSLGDEWERRNRAFHSAIEAGCGSPWLLHFCGILYDQLERYRRLFVARHRFDPGSIAEHRELMQRTLARSPRACGILAKHFRHASEVIMQAIDEQSANGTGPKPLLSDASRTPKNKLRLHL